MAFRKRHTLGSNFPIKSGPLSGASSLKGKAELAIQLVLRLLRIPTGKMRLLPDFLIIGAQKCGTTTLYKYLTWHPGVRRSWFKEVHFFDRYYEKGHNWYRSHFPLMITKVFNKKIFRKTFITGEASPDYLFLPFCAERAFRTIPEAKLIVLLRNPVDRAFSHYQHEVIRGREFLSFEKAIEQEAKRVQDEKERMMQFNNYSFLYDHYSYLAKGIYVDQLKVWRKFYPSEHILILKSERLYSEPQEVYQNVLEFLCLPSYELKNYGSYNVGKYKKLNTSVRKRLLAYFKPHNERLYRFIGKQYDWNRQINLKQ